MLACWYLLLGQFSVTFEYRPGEQHANADGMSRQCGQCQRLDCPVSAMDSPVPDAEPEMELVDQPFAASEMGESMDADLLPELSGETWHRRSWRSLRRICLRRGAMWTLLQHLARMRRWRRCGSGFGWNLLRYRRSVQDFLRSYVVGGCKWATYPLTWMGGYGGARYRRRRALNW